MPIDLRRLEQDPLQCDQYRSGHNDDDMLLLLLDAALHSRHRVKQLQKNRDARVAAKRRRDKEVQLWRNTNLRQREPENDSTNNNNKGQPQLVDEHQHHWTTQMEEELTAEKNKLEELLWKLPNFRDDVGLQEKLRMGGVSTDDNDTATSKIKECAKQSSNNSPLDHDLDGEKSSSTSHSLAPPRMDASVYIPDDPLYCAGCYEVIPTMGCGASSSQSTATTTRTVLVGPGIRMAHSIHDWFVTSLQHETLLRAVASLKKEDNSDASMPHWKLPASLETVTATRSCSDRTAQQQRPQPVDWLWRVTEVMKITTNAAETQSLDNKNNTHNIDGTASIRSVPSWLTVLRQQTGSYWDRQLPRMTLLSCTHSCADNNDSIIDGREEPVHKTNKKQAARRWYHRVALAERLELLILTGPSLEADSRPLQTRLGRRVRNLYVQLLLSASASGKRNTPSSNQGPEPTAMARYVTLELVSGKELVPLESSRLVVYGHWKNEASSRPPVCLAYLSNLQDYCGPEWRHGSTLERLHILHGRLVDIPTCMEWICHFHATDQSIHWPIPFAGSSVVATEPFVFLKYTREAMDKKKGNRLSGSSGHPLVESSEPNAAGTTKQIPRPTPDRIRAEARSSPYSFLPFYYK